MNGPYVWKKLFLKIVKLPCKMSKNRFEEAKVSRFEEQITSDTEALLGPFQSILQI